MNVIACVNGFGTIAHFVALLTCGGRLMVNDVPTYTCCAFLSKPCSCCKMVHDSCWELMIMSSSTNSQIDVDSTTNKRVTNYIHKGMQIMKPQVNQPHDYISWGCMWLNDHRFFVSL
jgi:hypothetical protein